MIAIGDRLPAGSLKEFVEVERDGCALGPNTVDVQPACSGRTIAIFAVPGAFTPTCSARHLPGYLEQAAALRAAGVDEIWCLSVNDVFVMGAWARAAEVNGRLRLLADGSADYTRALGLELDLSANGMGLRSRRYSMLVVDGVLRSLHVEAPGKFEVSDAATLLADAQALKR